jgi:AraC family transcriptional regulator
MSVQPLAIDYRQEAAPLKILPHMPLLSSHQSSWNTIHLAHHLQPAWELPEVYSEQHVIIIPMKYEATNIIEFVTDGQHRIVQYEANNPTKSDFGILPANLPYALNWNVEVEFIHCYLEPNVLAQIAHESVNPDRVELSLILKAADPLIYQIGQALKADLEIDGVGRRFYADSLTTALAAHLLLHYSTRKHKLRAYEDGLPGVMLKQAIEYINAHLGENLSLATMATILHISPYHFCRLFKQSTGMSPHSYLIQQRIERAKQLLQRPELTVTHIAGVCGFANQSHFAKYFRRYTGVSPMQFRQM